VFLLSEDQDISSADFWKKTGDEYIKQEKFEEAIKSYKESLEIDPNYVKVWNNLGYAYSKLGRFDEAKKCREKINALTALKSVSPKQEDVKPSAEIIEPAPPKPLTKADVDRRPFWLGILGGILGFFAAFALLAIYLISAVFSPLTGSDLDSTIILGQMLIVIIFSIFGLISGIAGESKISGILMIVSGIIVLIASSFLGILTTILFVVGGYILYKNAE
jgi:hypothetical protein